MPADGIFGRQIQVAAPVAAGFLFGAVAQQLCQANRLQPVKFRRQWRCAKHLDVGGTE